MLQESTQQGISQHGICNDHLESGTSQQENEMQENETIGEEGMA
jgi:hypothetical protein